MPKIFATVRVKSRILSRVIYSASQQGGGVALRDGSGTTFNVDKIDLGGVQNANATIRKDNQRTFQILPPSVGGDGEHQQFILSNAELFMQYFKSGEINVTLGMEKTGLGVLNVGGMYLIAQDGTATNVAGISILKNGSIAVGDNLGADRFTKMYYRNDNHAKWALLPQGEQDRIIPDIEWVLANSGSSEYLELGAFVPLMPFSTNGDYTNYTLTGDITINATGITFGKFRAVYITQPAGQTYKIDLGSNITQVFGVDPLDAGEFTLLPGSYMFYFASVRSGPAQGVHLNVPEGQEVTQTPPTIVSLTMDSTNDFGDLLISEPVWGNIGATAPVLLTKLNVVFAANGGTATDWIASTLTKTTGGALTGGETTLRVNGSPTGTPDGQETVTVGPLDAVSIFDGAGNAMDAGQSGVDNLQAGSIYEPESVALFARMATAGDEPDTTRKGHINTLIAGLKTDGDWAEMDHFIMTPAHAESVRLLNWIEDDFNGSEGGTIGFSADTPISLNGTNQYINTDFKPQTDGTNYIQDDCSYSVYVAVNSDTGATKGLFGSNQNSTSVISDISLYQTVGTTVFAYRSNHHGSYDIYTDVDGKFNDGTVYTVQRTGSTVSDLLEDNISLDTSSAASVAPPNIDLYVGAMNVETSGAGNWLNTSINAMWGGSSSINNSDVKARIDTFLTAIGL